MLCRERREMIDGHIWEERGSCGYRQLCEFTIAAVFARIHIIDGDVMDAVALTVTRGRAIVRQRIGNLQSGANVEDAVIPDRHITNLANWALGRPSRIFGGKHNRKTSLRETAPRIFHAAAFD